MNQRDAARCSTGVWMFSATVVEIGWDRMEQGGMESSSAEWERQGKMRRRKDMSKENMLKMDSLQKKV